MSSGKARAGRSSGEFPSIVTPTMCQCASFILISFDAQQTLPFKAFQRSPRKGTFQVNHHLCWWCLVEDDSLHFLNWWGFPQVYPTTQLLQRTDATSPWEYQQEERVVTHFTGGLLGTALHNIGLGAWWVSKFPKLESLSRAFQRWSAGRVRDGLFSYVYLPSKNSAHDFGSHLENLQFLRMPHGRQYKWGSQMFF